MTDHETYHPSPYVHAVIAATLPEYGITPADPRWDERMSAALRLVRPDYCGPERAARLAVETMREAL